MKFGKLSCFLIWKQEENRLQNMMNVEENLDKYKSMVLKNTWADAVSSWKVYIQDIEKEIGKSVKKTICSLVQSVILARKNIDIIPDLLMALIIELNHIILGNVHIIEETSQHLNILFDNYYREWKIDKFYLNFETKLDDELICEEQEEEEEAENLFTERFINILNEINMLKELRMKIVPNFKKTNHFQIIIQHLENCSENIKASETIIIECMESEYETLVAEKERISEARKQFSKSSTEGTKFENDLMRHNQYEEKLADLAFSAKYFFETTTNIISEATQGWNSLHEDKLEPVKRLTLLRIKQVNEEYNALTKVALQSLNIAIDQLRSTHSVAALDQSRNNIEKVHIAQLKKLNKEWLDRQHKILEGFQKRAQVCYEVFNEALDILTTEPSGSSVNSVPTQGSEFDLKTSIHIEEDPFHNMIEFIMKNANNWYNGFIEGLQFLRTELDMNLTSLENEWFFEQLTDIRFRCQLKEESIERTFKRIEEDVNDIRCSEIRVHENLVISYVNGIYEALSEMKKSVKTFEENFNRLDVKYEESYRELLKLKDIEFEETQFHKVLNTLKNVKSQLITLQDRRKHMGSRMTALVERRIEWILNNNMDFLSNVRMFKEGGTISSEEAVGIIYSISRVNAGAKKERKQLLSRIKKTLSKKVNSYSGVADKILEGMKKKSREVTFKLNLELTLDRTKRAISRELIKAQERVKRLENILEERKKSRRMVFWEDVVEEIVKCCSYLSNNLKEEETIKLRKSLRSRRTRSTSMAIRRSTSIPSPKLLSMKGKLNTAVTPDNFVFTINKFIKDSKWSIIRQVQNYSSAIVSTKKQSKKTRISSLSGGLDLLSQYENSFNRLRHTSKIAWLNLVYDTLCLLTLFRANLTKILESKCKVYEFVCKSKLNHIEYDYLCKIQQFEKVEESKLNELARKLKTTYTFPKNKPLLKDLEAEAVLICEQSILSYKNTVINFKEEIKGFLDVFTTLSNRLMKEMIYFVESIYKCKTVEEFLGNIDRNVRNIMERIKKDKKLEIEDREELLEEEETIGIECLFQNMPRLLSLLDSTLSLLTSRKTSRTLQDYTADTPIDYESIIYIMKQGLVASCRRLVESAIEKYRAHCKKVQKWFKTWQYDSMEIENLF